MPNIGGPELIIVLLIFVLLFGARKLPDLGRSMGQSITNFRKGMTEARQEELPSETAPQPPPPAATVEPPVAEPRPSADTRQP
jgi:sec-independent protein translocase protein TatA